MPNAIWNMLEATPGGMAFAVRDFALVTLAGELSATCPGQLVFKGGFVLRHAHGDLRFGKNVDAVAAGIREASIQNVVQFVPDEPADAPSYRETAGIVWPRIKSLAP